MTKSPIYGFFLIFISLLISPAAHTQTGLDFLNIGPNAHSLSLSEAHTAVPLGSNSIFTNPANLMLSEHSSLGVSYTLWIGDTQHTQASASIKRENDMFAAGVRSSVVDDITLRSAPGEPDGSFSVQYLSLSGAYARSISILSIGVAGSYIYEQLFQQNASGFGFNAGITAQLLDERLRIGTAVTNAGRMSKLDIERSELPTRWRTGFDLNAVQISAFGGSEVPVVINLSGDFIAPLKDEFFSNSENAIESGSFFAFGLQAELYEMIILRGGYRTGDTVRNWSAGAAINVDPVQFQYAFVPFETGFGMVHSISLQYFFDL